MNTDDLKDEDLNLLTDEERAGLADDDEGEEGDDNQDGDDDAGDDDGAGDDEGDEGADDADAGAADEGANAGAADKGAGEEGRDDGDDDDDTPSPRPTGERVNADEINGKLSELDTQKDALEKQLDDGEITTKEYIAGIDKLTEQKVELSGKLARQAEQDEAVQTAWYGDVQKFLTKNPELNANQTRLQSFDTVVRRVTADPESAGLSNRKQLEKAHAIWQEEMGIKPAAKDEPKAEGKEAGKAAKPKPKPKPELPPTLHNLPAADIEVGDDGKYSYLDGLLEKGMTIEYEDALAKLSEADQQDYLSRA
ncbi:hypothetical protein [Sphingobium yanoikuyae]|uniref:Uncharacterized protein n=1 Tax=Sphingobium yanoikuyae TaxID=13690 RepID=A0A3G2UV52_SPHYA|nr:hypothetical protein [Sphingobium yanoikuyae]AYO76441.1 hypothetical protein EBF16_05470 [Sphingobium yanoikuyae]